MTQYRVFILWYEYPTYLLQREGMGIRKQRKRGKRGIENKGNMGNGYPSGTLAGPSLLIWLDLSCFISFMLIQSWSL
jgi:hypothetical protein